MTIGVTAKIQVQEGKNVEFENTFKQLVAEVINNEQGCLLYSFNKSRQDPQTYIILEQYADKTALEAHNKTEYFQKFGQILAEYVASAPRIELMDSVD